MAGIINTSINQDDPFQKVAGVEAQTIDLDPATDTVEGRVQNIINRSGKNLQSEVTRAEQAQASKGLLNTSMSVGAAERARIDTALPIASQDAATSFEAKRANQLATQSASEFTAAEQNVAAQQERAGQQNIEQQTLSGEQQLAQQTLIGEQAIKLEEIASANKALIQTTASASQIYAQISASMSLISANPDIPPEQKQALINQQTLHLQNALAVLEGMTGIDTSPLLDFTGGNRDVTSVIDPVAAAQSFTDDQAARELMKQTRTEEG